MLFECRRQEGRRGKGDEQPEDGNEGEDSGEAVLSNVLHGVFTGGDGLSVGFLWGFDNYYVVTVQIGMRQGGVVTGPPSGVNTGFVKQPQGEFFVVHLRTRQKKTRPTEKHSKV